MPLTVKPAIETLVDVNTGLRMGGRDFLTILLPSSTCRISASICIGRRPKDSLFIKVFITV